MLKAIVAKVVRAAANVRRAGCALAEDLRGDARAASLVAAKKAVGAAFCGVATAVFLAPVSMLAVNDAAAQTQTCLPSGPQTTCTAQCKNGGTSTTGCGDCLDGYVEIGSVCELMIVCSEIVGQVPNESNDACVCPEDNFPIAGTCQVPADFCEGEGLSLRDTFGTLQNANDPKDPSNAEAKVAYCGECADGFEKFAGDCQRVKDCNVTSSTAGNNLFRGQFVDRGNQKNECVCPIGQTILPDPNVFNLRAKEQSDGADALGVKVCAPALPDYANDEYSSADCEAAGWEVTYWAVTLAATGEPQGGFHLVESCEIPVDFVANAVLTVLSTATAEKPAVTEIRASDPRTGSADSCILRHNMGADLAGAVGATNMLPCSHQNLFRTAGLPRKPDNFILADNDRLLVVSTMTADANLRISFKNQPVLPVGAAPIDPTGPTGPTTPPTTDPTTSPAASSGGGGGGGAGPAAGGGLLLVALAYYAFSGHDSGASFALTPQARYKVENDLELYRYGSRLEFRQDEWSLWWAADESSSGGGKSLNYGYGGQWSNDVLRASAGVNYGESRADMRAGLEAEWTLANWTIRPAYRFSAVSSDAGEWSVKNGLDLTAQMTQAGWTVRPSMNAGLWSGNSLNADLGLQVGREF